MPNLYNRAIALLHTIYILSPTPLQRKVCLFLGVSACDPGVQGGVCNGWV